MGTKFSKEQLEAINSSGNVIVSAGAGSGKTTVLTERVRRNIAGEGVKEKVSLDELLILTFTKDAAASMKEKIKDALGKDPSLSHLVPYVDSAHIETFDAYAQFIVTKYGYLENYPKQINIIEDDILFIKCSNFLIEILDNLYEKEDPILEELVYYYLPKGDNSLINFLRDIYFNILLKKDDPIEFLKTYKNKYLNEKWFNSLLEDINKTLLDDVNKLKEIVKGLVDFKLRDSLLGILNNFEGVTTINDLVNLKDSLIDPDSFKKIYKELNENVKVNKINSEIRELALVKEFEETYKNIFNFSTVDLDTFINIDIKHEIKFLTFIIDKILLPFIDRVDKFKLSTGFFSFSDVAKMAITIVKNHENVKNEVKNEFKLIMIDEYQDTSYGQEEFINLISNNNVFSVGDIKQSIYRFRGAVPDLFKAKYDAYSLNDGGIAINMNKNYRSRKEIINPINDMFSKLMKDDFGGANYLKDHIIEASNLDYDTFGTTKNRHGFYEIPNASLIGNMFDNVKTTGKEALASGEASLICLDIISRIKNGYEIYDSKNKCPRKAKYSDFSILTYKSTKFPIYQRIFKNFDIPLNVIYEESMTEDFSIIIVSNLLRLIYLLGIEEPSPSEKGEIKHLLISIFRSYLFEYNDQKLYELFNNESYFNDTNYINLKSLAKKYKDLPIHEVYLNIFNDLDYLTQSSKLKEVINSLDKNNILFNKTKIMDQIGYTLNDLSNYFKDLNKFSIQMDQTIYSDSKDAVTLTTVHKSKGLEYPLVYLPGLNDFNAPKNKDVKSKFYILNDYFFLPLFSDPKKKNNIFGRILIDNSIEGYKDKEERLRLFYVALTRAKEDIVFVYSDKAPLSESDYDNELTNEVKDNLLKGNSNISDNAIAISTLKRKEEIDKIDFGETFASFLFKANASYPLSEYLPSEFNNLETFKNIINESLNLNNSLSIKGLIKYYLDYNYSFNFINGNSIKKYLEIKKENISKNDNPIFKSPILFNGYKKIDKDDYLLKVEVIDNKKGGYKVNATFLPNRIYSFISEDYNLLITISEEIKNDKFTTLLNKIKFNNNDANKDMLELNKKLLSLKDVDSSITLKELHVAKEYSKEKVKASKDIDDEVNESALHYGTHMHALLEMVDFKSRDLSKIKNQKEKDIILKVINKLDELDIKDASIYKEYQFFDERINLHGVIDLLLIYKDHAIIIDYKLKNIDDLMYNRQLNLYKDYVKEAFKLNSVDTYLLSIIDARLEKRG